MKALILHAPGDLRFQDAAMPSPPAGWCLVKTAFAGICGSDIPRVYGGKAYHYPLICGHEFSGTIEMPADTGKCRRGDRVTVFPLIWCGHCPACEKGIYAQCENYDYLGSRRDGAFAEYVAAPERNLVRIPDGVTMEEAALTEPAAVACRAVFKAVGHYTGKSVAVFGAGPIGLLVAQWARAAGADKVVVMDIINAKLEVALSLGADATVNPLETDAAEALCSHLGGAGADVCVEASGSGKALNAAIIAAAPGGTVIALGNHGGGVALSPEALSALNRRELTIRGSWNSEFRATSGIDDWRRALSAMSAGKLNPTPLITNVVPLSEGVETFAAARSGGNIHLKILLQA